MSEALPIPSLTGSEKRALGVIAPIAMLRMIGLFALLPVLSLHAATLAGQTPLLIGFAVGAYGLTQAGLQIPLGALSDRIGRVPVILGGLAVFALGSVLAGLADSIGELIAGRLLQGAGAISATLTALVADATRNVVRTRSMAVLGVGIGGSFLIAMVFGPWFAARFGVPALFGFATAAAALAAALLLLLPRDIERLPAPERWDFRAALAKPLLPLHFYVFLLHAILTASFVALPFLLSRRLGLPLGDHWQMYIGAILVSLAGTVPLILKDERRGKSATVGIAVLLVLVGELLLAFSAASVPLVFAALCVFFAGFNFLEAALPARLSILAEQSSRGTVLGVFASAQFAGAAAGGLIGGRFLAAGNPGDVFFVCMLLAAIWLAMAGLRGKGPPPGPQVDRDAI